MTSASSRPRARRQTRFVSTKDPSHRKAVQTLGFRKFTIAVLCLPEFFLFAREERPAQQRTSASFRYSPTPSVRIE